MSHTENGKHRRQRERLHLSLPMQVRHRDNPLEEQEETTRLIDVTPFGAGFVLTHPVEVGCLLQLTIPMPRQLRCYDHLEPQYKVWALVRHVRQKIDDQNSSTNYLIGAAFIGKYPPAGYWDNPRQLYEAIEPDAVGFWSLREVHAGNTETDETAAYGRDLRRHKRHQIPMNVTVEVFNERGDSVASERTVTENISLIGASVFTTLDVERGRFVRISSDQYDITIVAVVRSRQIGEDGSARLHLEFIDRQFPLEIVE